MRLGRMSRALVNVVVIATTLVLRAGAAFAQSYPGGNQTPPPTAVKGQRLFRGPNPADTGTDILLFILLALLALVIGLYLHRISRRRADGHAD
jgi:hypothetical protein